MLFSRENRRFVRIVFFSLLSQEVKKEHQESQQKHELRHGWCLLRHILRWSNSKLYANKARGSGLETAPAFP
jgi:hypothetical protein